MSVNGLEFKSSKENMDDLDIANKISLSRYRVSPTQKEADLYIKDSIEQKIKSVERDIKEYEECVKNSKKSLKSLQTKLKKYLE